MYTRKRGLGGDSGHGLKLVSGPCVLDPQTSASASASSGASDDKDVVAPSVEAVTIALEVVSVSPRCGDN